MHIMHYTYKRDRYKSIVHCGTLSFFIISFTEVLCGHTSDTSLVTLQVTSAAALEPFLSDPEPRVVTAALGRLVHLDQPLTALPLLLTRLGGDEARTAAFGIRASLRMNPGQVVRALEPLLLPAPRPAQQQHGLEVEEVLQGPRMKVTAQKEAVRLLELAGTPEVRKGSQVSLS
jgi:hypothetical protein